MTKFALLLAAAMLPVAATAATPQQIADDVSRQQLHATVEKLVSFGTRHTLSSQTDPKRGIGAATRWAEEEFQRYSTACGGCLTIATPSDTVTGRRVPSRSEERRVGKEGVSTGRFRWSLYH